MASIQAGLQWVVNMMQVFRLADTLDADIFNMAGKGYPFSGLLGELFTGGWKEVE